MPCTRITDTTVGLCYLGLFCCPHAPVFGMNLTASPKTSIDFLPTHRVGDTGIIFCPHLGFFSSVSGATKLIVNGSPQTRLGDVAICMKCGCPSYHDLGSYHDFVFV